MIAKLKKSNEFTPPNLASSIHYPVRVPMNLFSGLVLFAASHFPWQALHVFLRTLLRSLLQIHFHSFSRLFSTEGFLLELWLCLWLYQWESCSRWTKRSEECGGPGQRGRKEYPGALYCNGSILEGLWTCDSGDSLSKCDAYSLLVGKPVCSSTLTFWPCMLFLPAFPGQVATLLPFAFESHCKYF